MMQQDKIFIGAYAAICSAGENSEAIESVLLDASGESAANTISMRSNLAQEYAVPLGSVEADLPMVKNPADETRSNRLVMAAIEPLRNSVESLKKKYGKSRIGAVIGTSTSGIATAEEAFIQNANGDENKVDYDYRLQELSAPTQFLMSELGINGPGWSVSTACTSGAKSLSMGARLLRTGLVDAVVVGGVDSLCRMTIEGFSSLSVISDERCLPFSQNRKGINIGEGAAFFILSKEENDYYLSGYGESSDAYHISAPHPEGQGASAAMLSALESAQLTAQDIGYINLHGTATLQNDLIESHVVSDILGQDIACSSTKGIVGHTLAAAGALETLFCLYSLKHDDGSIPLHLSDGALDSELGVLNRLGKAASGKVMHAMNNSFAFGGNNISLILSRF